MKTTGTGATATSMAKRPQQHSAQGAAGSDSLSSSKNSTLKLEGESSDDSTIISSQASTLTRYIQSMYSLNLAKFKQI